MLTRPGPTEYAEFYKSYIARFFIARRRVANPYATGLGRLVRMTSSASEKISKLLNLAGQWECRLHGR